MEGTRFRLDIKLQNLSMISVATKLWDSQDIKNRIKNHRFSGLDCNYPDRNWCGISKLVIQYANSINLPSSLSVLLKKTILFIGQKIYDWIVYVTKYLELDLIFAQKIYFRFGAVDEIKIFDLYWRDLTVADDFVYESKYFTHSPLFSLACMYGCEKFVKERKKEMLDELSEFYPEIKTGDEIYNIISVSICMTEHKSILENVDSPKRMFKLCLEEGFSKAARFYWEKLDEVEKVSNLTNFAKKCWPKHYQTIFMVEKDCENLLFLINQMGEEERCLFVTKYADKIITLFLPIWPYQELIVDLLKYDWNVESSRLRNMANFVIWYSNAMNRLEFPLDNELIFQIMEKVWENLPFDEKLYCISKNREIISSFFLSLNLEILTLLFNDPSITEVVDPEMDSLIKYGFLDLVKIGKFDFLTEIIEKVFYFIPEPKEFLKENFSNYDFVDMLMENDEPFGLVDQFLDWSTESEAERARLKDKINTISVCRILTEPAHGPFKFELAEKFLKWKLESDCEVKRFKEAMKSYNFVIVDYLKYVRIRTGDLSWLKPGDSLATHPDDDPIDNAEGLTFLKFEEATELNRGVVLGIKSFSSGVNDDFLGPDGLHAKRWNVSYAGTKVEDFIVFTVRQFWNNLRQSYVDLETTVNLSNGFIKFYYETDEEVLKFKKTKLQLLVTENRMEILLDVLKDPGGFPKSVLDDFCEFCMIPSEKIEEIKIQHRRDIEEFLDNYLINQLSFNLVDIYLSWLFGDIKKTEVSNKFLNSSNKGALLCVSYFKRWSEVCPIGYSDFEICTWLNLIDDVEKLKNDVFALNENTPVWFPTLLERSAHVYSMGEDFHWPIGR